MHLPADLASHRLDHSKVSILALAGCTSMAIAAADLLTYHLNFPIAYIVPLLMVEMIGRRSLLWQSAATLVVLTFAGYFLGNRPAELQHVSDLISPQFVNRLLAAGAIVATAALLDLGLIVGSRLRLRRNWPHDPDGSSFQRVLHSLERPFAPVLALILAAVLFAYDVNAQPEYNIALLYGLPLIIVARTRSAPIVWTALVLLVVAALCGLWLGPLAEPARMSNLALNRVLACLAMASVAVLLHFPLRLPR